MPALVGSQLGKRAGEAQQANGVRIAHRFRASDQNGSRFPLWLRDEVQTVVHSIDEVDIGVARRSEKSLGPGGTAIAVGVAGLVAPAHIGLSLRDAAYQITALGQAADNVFAQQLLGNLHRVAQIKFPGKPCHFLTSVVTF